MRNLSSQWWARTFVLVALCLCGTGCDGDLDLHRCSPEAKALCPVNSVCRIVDGEAVCVCDDGYIMAGDECIPAPPCIIDADCDDDNPCTDDFCKPVSGCEHVNNTDSCDDGNACTVGDQCSSGECASGQPVDCSGPGNQCRADSTCDPTGSEGNCDMPGTPINDGLACNEGNTCMNEKSCSNGFCIGGTPASSGTSCNDGVFCNGTDICDGSGVCVHAGDPCGAFSCVEFTDTCSDEIWYGLGGSDFGSWKDHIGGDVLPVGGGISQDPDSSIQPDLVIDDSGSPVVAWSNGSNIYVRRFDGIPPGGTWVEVGSGSATGEGIGSCFDCQSHNVMLGPTMVKDSDGNLFAAYDKTKVKKFDGSTWIDMGGPDYTEDCNNFSMHSHALTVDEQGVPLLAASVWCCVLCTGGHPPDNIRTARHNGNSWNEIELLTDVVQEGFKDCQLSMTIDSSGNPVLAWSGSVGTDRQIYVAMYDGSTWIELGEGSFSDGGISSNIGDSVNSCIVLDAAGNPIVAWADNSSGIDEIYMKRYDGNVWVEVGTASATNGGVSANASASINPSLAIDSAGRPVVAWEDHSLGEPEIYIKGFDGTNWVEIGTGSASGGGVSNSATGSYNPSLAIGGGRICVAWSELGLGSEQIVMRCADE
jgi:hypothetical protein